MGSQPDSSILCIYSTFWSDQLEVYPGAPFCAIPFPWRAPAPPGGVTAYFGKHRHHFRWKASYRLSCTSSEFCLVWSTTISSLYNKSIYCLHRSIADVSGKVYYAINRSVLISGSLITVKIGVFDFIILLSVLFEYWICIWVGFDYSIFNHCIGF